MSTIFSFSRLYPLHLCVCVCVWVGLHPIRSFNLLFYDWLLEMLVQIIGGNGGTVLYLWSSHRSATHTSVAMTHAYKDGDKIISLTFCKVSNWQQHLNMITKQGEKLPWTKTSFWIN